MTQGFNLATQLRILSMEYAFRANDADKVGVAERFHEFLVKDHQEPPTPVQQVQRRSVLPIGQGQAAAPLVKKLNGASGD
jgi:hypothetical protein